MVDMYFCQLMIDKPLSWLWCPSDIWDNFCLNEKNSRTESARILTRLSIEPGSTLWEGAIFFSHLFYIEYDIRISKNVGSMTFTEIANVIKWVKSVY